MPAQQTAETTCTGAEITRLLASVHDVLISGQVFVPCAANIPDRLLHAWLGVLDRCIKYTCRRTWTQQTEMQTAWSSVCMILTSGGASQLHVQTPQWHIHERHCNESPQYR